jgi:beta-N-acetylhexosaminidase
MRKTVLLFFLLSLFASVYTFAQSVRPQSQQPPFINEGQQWVDSVMRTLSPDERVAQLMMVAAYSNRSQAHVDTIVNLVAKHKIGGLMFMQGGPYRQARLNNLYQSHAKVPLLISIDGEWGLAMRLDSTPRFPFQMAMGAVQNDQLIYNMGAEVAKHCRRMGIHVNFAPVIDVNNNPANPVINYRSFGENKYRVAAKGVAYMKGLQDNRVLANAKHFPGHGDTDTDSHYALPLIQHNRQRLDSIELYPFQELFRQGLGSIMVAHLNIPALDAEVKQSTLSKKIVTDLLKNEMGFKGLVFTDALNMKGVSSFYAPGIVDLKALLAGNDVLLFAENVPVALREIRKAVQAGQISQKEIDARCRKVLAAKYWVGLSQYQPVDERNLFTDLNNPNADLIYRQLAEGAQTLLSNNNNVVPIRNLDKLRIASISLQVEAPTFFQEMLANYTQVDAYTLSASSTPAQAAELMQKLQQYDLIITGVHLPNQTVGRNFNISPQLPQWLAEITQTGKALVAVFGNAYSLSRFPALAQSQALLLGYQDNAYMHRAAAHALFGATPVNGRLPVTVNEVYREGMGLETAAIGRLKYTIPEEVNLDSRFFARIDSLAWQAIEQKATPGCQVLVAKDGKVIYQKSFGNHTYEQAVPVRNNDIYDLASITKVGASVAALMHLQDKGKFNPDAQVGTYLPELKGSNKESLTFRDLLTHQARLKAWIPFWRETLRKKDKDNVSAATPREFRWYTFKADSSRRFPVKVADNLYLHRNYKRKIYKNIRISPLNDKEGYVYSDLSFYLYPSLVEKQSGQPFEAYLRDNLYKPLGATTLTFNPRRFYTLEQIVPTEHDSLFRKELIHGRVHDEGAAMIEGVSGHAGLFGNANDLAKLMQMYLQRGYYGGQQLIQGSTVDEYSRCQYCDTGNRRALGFDRPATPWTPNSNAAKGASMRSFGHAGFTGTYTWVDPEEGLVYVFLSNRVYPTRENPRLGQLNTRTNIHQVVYEAIEASKIQAVGYEQKGTNR